METWPGRTFPLGATWDGEGTNFSLFSENAESVKLCLFDEAGLETSIERRGAHRLQLALLPARCRPRPALRLSRPRPLRAADGHRFNPHKLLLDPYAKAITGEVDWSAANVLPYVPGTDPADEADLEPDDEDDAEAMPKAVVIDEAFDWEGDRRLETPWPDTVIYEAHVKGFTMRHPDVREDLRGTYAGLASEPALAHLQSLGVTAVELLPIHQIVPRRSSSTAS